MTLKYQIHFQSREDQEYFEKCFYAKKPQQGNRYLLAFFHQDELSIMNFWRNRKMSVLVSVSKDGEIMNHTAKFLGFETVRGSSSKKAVSGLISAIKKVKAGYDMSFAVDGPRGPLHEVKEGICAISRKTGVKIIPARAVPSRAKIFEKSWSKAKFPLPFSKIDIHFAPAKNYTRKELQDTMVNLI